MAGGSADDADRALVERVRQGDVAAFGEIVRRYQRRAWAVAWRLLRNREDAEDLVQDAFLTVLDKLDRYDAGRPFAPWFFKVLVNRGLSLRERARIREAAPLPEELVGTGGTDRRAERSEVRARVDRALAGLSDRQRMVVQLYELDGYSSPEIAEMLNVAEGTVRWTLHEARKNLREALAPLKEDYGNA